MSTLFLQPTSHAGRDKKEAHKRKEERNEQRKCAFRGERGKKKERSNGNAPSGEREERRKKGATEMRLPGRERKQKEFVCAERGVEPLTN